MTKRKYARRKIMLLIGLLVVMVVSLADTGIITYAKNYDDGFGIHIEMEHDSGVTELDEAMGRGDKLGESVVKFLGRWVAIFAFLFFIVSFPSHQSEMRIIAFFAFVIGLGMYFGPEIIDGLLGKK